MSRAEPGAAVPAEPVVQLGGSAYVTAVPSEVGQFHACRDDLSMVLAVLPDKPPYSEFGSAQFPRSRCRTRMRPGPGGAVSTPLCSGRIEVPFDLLDRVDDHARVVGPLLGILPGGTR